MKKFLLPLIFFGSINNFLSAQVIDMHMHSYTEKDFWTGVARNGLLSSKTSNDHLQETIRKMDQHKITYAVICGTIESITKYSQADKRFIPAYQDYEETLLPVHQFEAFIKEGKIKVFGEVMAVYKGKTLADSVYQPTWV